jgi:hypothetical protein
MNRAARVPAIRIELPVLFWGNYDAQVGSSVGGTVSDLAEAKTDISILVQSSGFELGFTVFAGASSKVIPVTSLSVTVTACLPS